MVQLVVESYVPCVFHNLGNLEASSLFSDYKTGFGGKFGVQSDRVDKSALSWDHHEQLNKHESQASLGLLRDPPPLLFRFFDADYQREVFQSTGQHDFF